MRWLNLISEIVEFKSFLYNFLDIEFNWTCEDELTIKNAISIRPSCTELKCTTFFLLLMFNCFFFSFPGETHIFYFFFFMWFMTCRNRHINLFLQWQAKCRNAEAQGNQRFPVTNTQKGVRMLLVRRGIAARVLWCMYELSAFEK